jgi:hypothetical protein
VVSGGGGTGIHMLSYGLNNTRSFVCLGSLLLFVWGALWQLRKRVAHVERSDGHAVLEGVGVFKYCLLVDHH